MVNVSNFPDIAEIDQKKFQAVIQDFRVKPEVLLIQAQVAIFPKILGLILFYRAEFDRGCNVGFLL